MRGFPRAVFNVALWPRIGGPLLALLAALAIEWSSRGPLRIPNPPAVLLFTVVFSAFVGGLGSGLVAGLVAWLYIAHFFAVPGQPLQYAVEDLRRVIVWAIAIPGMAVMVGILKRSSERASRISAENAALVEQIGGRRRAEEALRLSERRFRVLIEHGSDAVSLTASDGSVVYVSPATTRILGYSPEEMVGQPALAFIHPEDREAVAKTYAELREQPERAQHQEIRVRHKDGSWRWIEAVRTNLLADPSVGAFVSNFRDVTERKSTEETLRRFAATVEDSDDAIFAKALDGAILSWNSAAERIYGYSAEEILGRPVTVLAPEERRQEISDLLGRLVRGERIEHFETVRVRKDGTPIDVALTISPIRDSAGKTVGASVIGRDISERKRADREIRALNRDLENRVRQRTSELQAANKELEAFAHTVAHDLRSPLITLSGFAEILIEDHRAALPEEAQRLILEIAHSAQHMNSLIGELLAFSRLVRQPLTLESIDPADVVRQALSELDGEGGRRAAVHLNDLPSCQADPSLLKQVFVNLLSNALKFTRNRKDAAVEVGWRRDLDETTQHTYFVADNGVGFDMRYADKLFRLFQRLHRAEEYEGTGVGLTIVQRIIDRHGGRVWAEGAPGKGATFYFTLPRSGAA